MIGCTEKNVVIKTLAHKLGVTDKLHLLDKSYGIDVPSKVYARNTKIATISNTEARNFLNDNHLQGAVKSDYVFALKDTQGRIRSVLCVNNNNSNKILNRKDGEFEIVRYSSLGSVIGGASKLLKFAEVELKKRRFTTMGEFLS